MVSRVNILLFTLDGIYIDIWVNRHKSDTLAPHVLYIPGWILPPIYNLWPALPKPATYIHYGKEQLSLSMGSSINKLTNYQCTAAKCWWVCFCWGLLLRPVRHPRVFGCPLNATGWLVQAVTLLVITTQLVNRIGHAWVYLCFVSAMEPLVGHFKNYCALL